MEEKNLTGQHRNEVEKWLKSKSKDFDEGFELFARFSHNRALALQLARKRSLSKLEYELSKIASRAFIKESRIFPATVIKNAASRNQSNQETGQHVAETEKKVKVITDKVNREDLPVDLQKRYDSTVEDYKIMRAVHEKMKQCKKEGERAKLRQQLVALDDQIAASWKAIDDWVNKPEAEQTNENDSIQEQAPEELSQNSLALAKELNACRSYLSRNVKKAAMLEGKKREDLLNKLSERLEILLKNNAEIKESTIKELKKLNLM